MRVGIAGLEFDRPGETRGGLLDPLDAEQRAAEVVLGDREFRRRCKGRIPPQRLAEAACRLIGLPGLAE